MSKYFEENEKYKQVVYQEQHAPQSKPGSYTDPMPEDIDVFIKWVDEEIAKLLAGTSSFRKGGIHLSKGISPAISTWSRFKENKDPRDLHRFIFNVSEEFSRRVAGEIKNKFIEIYPAADKWHLTKTEEADAKAKEKK